MRPIWNGSLAFGLVNFPVSLYTALNTHGLSFHLFHKTDKSPIHYARICEKEQKEVDWEEVVKGTEVKKGKYVFLTEEELKMANVEKSSTIEILGFVEIAEIDVAFYNKPYYLAPKKNGSKPYFLLHDALEESNMVGLCRYVLHSHEYLGILIPSGDILILEQLHYFNDFRNVNDLPIEKAPKKSTKEFNIALRLIDEMRIDFEPEKYQDTYVNDLKKMIEMKAKGKKIPIKRKKQKMIKSKDLAGLLSKSLEQKRKSA